MQRHLVEVTEGFNCAVQMTSKLSSLLDHVLGRKKTPTTTKKKSSTNTFITDLSGSLAREAERIENKTEIPHLITLMEVQLLP